MKLARRFCYLFLLLASGCAALGVPTPTNFNERVAAAYTTTTALVETTRTLLVAKKITPADAENVLKQTDTVIAGLDIARSYSATSPIAANDKLTATLTILQAIQAYLNAHKGTP
jgi:hypothetical protein